MFCSVSCQRETFKQHNIACKKVTKAQKEADAGEIFVNSVFTEDGAPVCWTDSSIFTKAKFFVDFNGSVSFYSGMCLFTNGKVEGILAMYEIAIKNRSSKGLEKVLNEALENVKLVQPILQELRYLTSIVMLELGRIDDAYNQTKFWVSSILRRLHGPGLTLVKEVTMENQDKEENLLQVVEHDFETRLRISDVFHLVHLAFIKYEISQDELAEECLEIINKHCPGLIWIFLNPIEEGKEAFIPDEIVIKVNDDNTKNVKKFGIKTENYDREFCEYTLQTYGPPLNYYLEHRPDVKGKFEDFMIRQGFPKTPNHYGWIRNKTQ